MIRDEITMNPQLNKFKQDQEMKINMRNEE